MRTLVVVHRFFPDSTYGTETLALYVAEELRRRGDEVSIVCGKPSVNKVNAEFRLVADEFDGFQVNRAIYCEGSQRTLADRTFRNKAFGRSFREFLDSRKPDRAIVFHAADLSGIVLELLGRVAVSTVLVATDFWMICPKGTLLKASNELCIGPSLISANCVGCFLQQGRERLRQKDGGGEAQHPTPRWMPNHDFAKFLVGVVRRKRYLRRQLEMLEAVAVPTRFMGEILKRNGIPEQVIRPAPYGLDLARIRPARRTKGPAISFGYVGRLLPHKGIDTLVSAFRRANVEDSATLSIYGDYGVANSDNLDLLELAARQSPSIKLLGRFAPDEISRVMSGLDVLVVPSTWYENSPLIILFAFASGIPVIGSNVPGISEIVEHKVNGLLFERGNVEQLSAHIKTLVEDHELLRKMALNISHVKGIGRYVDELEAFFSAR